MRSSCFIAAFIQMVVCFPVASHRTGSTKQGENTDSATASTEIPERHGKSCWKSEHIAASWAPPPSEKLTRDTLVSTFLSKWGQPRDFHAEILLFEESEPHSPVH